MDQNFGMGIYLSIAQIRGCYLSRSFLCLSGTVINTKLMFSMKY